MPRKIGVICLETPTYGVLASPRAPCRASLAPCRIETPKIKEARTSFTCQVQAHGWHDGRFGSGTKRH
jgi:hypothetical protein